MTIAVIGRGLIGSAAARHLAQAGQQVVLVGPSEPADLSAHDGVFASHYDEGRITRALDPSPFWSRVARDSILRYQGIEADSGVRFFHPRGLIMAGPVGADLVNDTEQVAIRAGIDFETYRGAALKTRFPYLGLPDHTVAFFEPAVAGYINPRAMVQAQVAAAQAAGAQLLDSYVTGLSETGSGVTVHSASGAITVDQVLVAAGGFSNMVLPRPLPLSVYARTVAFLEIGPEEQDRLQSMPPVIWLGPAGDDPYVLPPIRYPDGKTYLKIGGDPEDVLLPDSEATKAWFRSGGNSKVAALLAQRLRDMLPGLQVRSSHAAACVTTFTEANLPALQRLSDRISVATAGCGKAAKSSDELGRLGAELTLGRNLPDWALCPEI